MIKTGNSGDKREGSKRLKKKKKKIKKPGQRLLSLYFNDTFQI